MLGGVVIFALVTWLFLEDSFGPVEPEAASVLYLAWIGVAIVGIVGWSMFRRKAVAAAGARSLRTSQGHDAHVTVLRHLIVGWALLEAVALFGIVVYGLTGRTAALVASVVVMGFGVARSWPDESWFPAEQVG